MGNYVRQFRHVEPWSSSILLFPQELACEIDLVSSHKTSQPGSV